MPAIRASTSLWAIWRPSGELGHRPVVHREHVLRSGSLSATESNTLRCWSEPQITATAPLLPTIHSTWSADDVS